RGRQYSGFATGPIVGSKSVEGEGVEVDVLTSVCRPSGIRHLGDVAAVLTIAELPFEKVETVLGRGEGRLFLDPGCRQGAEKPELSSLECEEFFPGGGEPVSPERLEIAALLAIHTGGQVEIDDARLEDLPAAARLSLHVGRRRTRGCS